MYHDIQLSYMVVNRLTKRPQIVTVTKKNKFFNIL